MHVFSNTSHRHIHQLTSIKCGKAKLQVSGPSCCRSAPIMCEAMLPDEFNTFIACDDLLDKGVICQLSVKSTLPLENQTVSSPALWQSPPF